MAWALLRVERTVFLADHSYATRRLLVHYRVPTTKLHEGSRTARHVVATSSEVVEEACPTAMALATRLSNNSSRIYPFTLAVGAARVET